MSKNTLQIRVKESNKIPINCYEWVIGSLDENQIVLKYLKKVKIKIE